MGSDSQIEEFLLILRLVGKKSLNDQSTTNREDEIHKGQINFCDVTNQWVDLADIYLFLLRWFLF